MEAWGRFFNPVMLIVIVIVAILPVSAQQVGTRKNPAVSLITLYRLFANGDALVEQNVVIEDPLAEEARINLFGDDISDLVVVDYEDNAVEFKRGEIPNEIVLNRPNATNLKISYTTSDFLSKDRREWIFSLNSTVSLSVKLLPDSILTDPGENPLYSPSRRSTTPDIQAGQYTIRLCNRNFGHSRTGKHCHKSWPKPQSLG